MAHERAVELQPALSQRGTAGGRCALGVEVPRIVEPRLRPFEPGLRCLERLGCVVLIDGAALLEQQAAVGIGHHQSHREQHHHHDDERRTAALGVLRGGFHGGPHVGQTPTTASLRSRTSLVMLRITDGSAADCALMCTARLRT